MTTAVAMTGAPVRSHEARGGFVLRSDTLAHPRAGQARRTCNEQHQEKAEDDDLLVDGGDVGGEEGLEETDEDAAEHRQADLVKTTQDRRDESLETERQAESRRREAQWHLYRADEP